MLKIVLRFLWRSVVLLWPFLLPFILKLAGTEFRFVDQLHLKIGADGKVSAEPWVRVALSFVMLAATFAYDLYEYYEPRNRAERFNKNYVTTVVFAAFKESLQGSNVNFGEDVRINALLAARPLYRLRRFKWLVWDGYSYSQGIWPDAELGLWGFQGVSGKVMREKTRLSADLRGPPALTWADKYLLQNEYCLCSGQLKKTSHVQYILSVPMLKTLKETPTLRQSVVGVFNVDAVSGPGAAWVEKNAGSIAAFLLLHGKVLAELA